MINLSFLKYSFLSLRKKIDLGYNFVRWCAYDVSNDIWKNNYPDIRHCKERDY
jgi:hypothetical protein